MSIYHRRSFMWGCFLAGLAVVLGAFAAHSLEKLITSEHIRTFETGVRYQFFHAIGLLAIGLSKDLVPGRKALWGFLLFIAGIILFSGSLYLLATRMLWGDDSYRWIGMITPLGGLSFIAGWFYLFIALFRSTVTHQS